MTVRRRGRHLRTRGSPRRASWGGRRTASVFLFSCCLAAVACANAADGRSTRRDSRRADGDRLLTATQLQACLSRKEAVRREADAALDEKSRIDAEKVEIGRIGENLAAERLAIDRTQAERVDAYNQKSAQRDQRIDDYQARVVRYNSRAEGVTSAQAEYAKACENRRYDERDLIDLKRKTR